EGYAQRLRPLVADTSLFVDRALRDGKDVLFEGAQATLLDLDHGTYPFVTSSNPVAANAATGVGIGPQRIDRVIGVSKAYVTRVGEGPFPSEIPGTEQARMRELGGEYGTVTGRERRCGWLDLVALRYAVRVNGIDQLALTKLDVLSHFSELPVCVRYRTRDGSETRDFPAHQSDFHAAEPVYETLEGWREPLDGCSSVAELPDAARGYVEFVERELEVEVTLVGTGAERSSAVRSIAANMSTSAIPHMQTATRRATRAISATAAGASAMKATTSWASATSNTPVPNGSDSAGASSTSRLGKRSRKTVTNSGDGSAAATETPRESNSAVRAPVPAPTSSARMPRVTPTKSANSGASTLE